MLHPLSRLILPLYMCAFCACSKEEETTASTSSSTDSVASKNSSIETPVENKGDPARQSAAEQIDSTAGIALDLPGFNTLSLNEKKRVFDMTEVIGFSESINFAMAGADALRTRRILLGILKAKHRIPDSIRNKIQPYAKKFFLNVGPLDVFTGERFRPGFIPGELAAAAKTAIDAGIDLGIDDFDSADLGANRLEQLEAMLRSIHPVVFGVKQTIKKSGSNKENSDGQAKMDKTVFHAALKQLASPLEKLSLGLSEPAKASFNTLVQYVKSPTKAGFSSYVRAYLNAPAEEISLFMGPIGPAHPIEAGKAPLYRFEGLVAIQDRDQSDLLSKLALEIPYFERLLPGNAMFLRPKKAIHLPVASAYHLVSAAPFGAVALPAFRLPAPIAFFDVPSKVMLFTNILDAEDRILSDVTDDMLAAEGPSRARLSKWRRAAATAFWSMKSVVGYELGIRNRLESAKEQMRYQSDVLAIAAEIHSDLAALHFVFDSKVKKIGLVPETECASAVLDAYLARFLIEAPLDSPDPTSRVGRSVIARRIVVRQLLNKHGVTVIKENGHYVISLTDEDALRRGVENLMANAQRMVSIGDEKTGAQLIEAHGGALPLTWQKDVTARLESHRVPIHRTFLYPEFEVKRAKDSSVKDITLKRMSEEP